MGAMQHSNYGHGFQHGVTIRGMPVLNAYSKGVLWVDSNGAQTGNGTFQRPFLTIDAAINHAAAGDIIAVKEGHSETVTAAAGIDADVAGISIIGLGNGRRRPTVNFTTATTADIDIDAANISISNMFFDLTGVDALVAPFDVNAADFTLEGCEILMADACGQAVECILTATAADRMRVIGNTFRATNAGANNAISIEGTPDGIEIAYNHIYGDFADACIHNPACNVATNLKIHHNYLQNDQNGDHAIELVSASTGVIHDNMLVTDAIATAADWGACQNFNNKYADDGDTDKKAVDIPLEAAAGSTQDLVNVVDALYGSTGIATFPAAAAAANSVSLAEVVRYVSEYQIGRITSKAIANAAITLTTGASPVTLFTVTGNVKARVYAVVTTALASTLNNGTLAVGVSGNTGGFMAATTADGTNFATNTVWAGDTSATLLGEVLTNGSLNWVLVGNGADIIVTVATNSMTAGALTFYCEYIPLDSSSTVVAA